MLLVRQGNLADARTRLLDARREGLRSPQEALALAALRFVTRDYHDSLAALDLAADLGAGPVALRQKARDAVRLGWELDACSALRRGAALFPRDPAWRSALLALHARRRDHEGAFLHGKELLALKPQASEALIELASLRIARGEYGSAKTLLDAALSQPLSGPARVEAARLRRASGSFPEARALLASLTAGPLGAEARRMLAELALWSGEADQAEEILAAQGEEPGTARLRGILAALRGQSDEALRLFERAISLDPEDSEALVWLAERVSLRGEHERARGLLTRAMMSARGQTLVASLLWLLNDLRAGPIPPSLPPALVGHLLPVTTVLCPELDGPLRRGDPGAWVQAIERCLDRMQGNRSTTPTWLHDQGLALLPPCPDPRVESRRALEQIRVAPREQALADLEALAPYFPGSGLPHAHRGELLLWLGETRAARRALEQAIEVYPQTRWAYIGLTMCDLLDGDPERALATSARGVAAMSNTEGPAVSVHRGEALRRLGRISEARADLERAVAVHPSRVGAWVNLGLLGLAQGERAAVRAAVERVLWLAPGLLSDAARVEGVSLFPGRGVLAEEAFAPVLERALLLLQGNRSSSLVSYLTPEGALRFGLQGGQDREPLHREDEARIARAEALLHRGDPGDVAN